MRVKVIENVLDLVELESLRFVLFTETIQHRRRMRNQLYSDICVLNIQSGRMIFEDLSVEQDQHLLVLLQMQRVFSFA